MPLRAFTPRDINKSSQRLFAVAPVASGPAFTARSYLNLYAVHYRRPFAFCYFLCPLRHGLCLRSGCPSILANVRAMHGVYLVSQSAHSDGYPMKGLGTFYPPHALGNPLQWMTNNGLRDAFWLQLLHLHEETSVSCLLLTTVQSNVHIYFPYPLPWRASTVLLSRLGCLYKQLMRARSLSHAARLTIAPHPPITRDARTVRVTSFQRWFR